MNQYPPIMQINNSILYSKNASPMPVLGVGAPQEHYQYQRTIPPLGIETTVSQLRKKFYGNSSNRSASAIAEKLRIKQSGNQTTRPTKMCAAVGKSAAIQAQYSALRGLRNSGYIVPQKCIKKPLVAQGIQPVAAKSISINPGNPGGHSWYNLGHKRWAKFCAAKTPPNVSTYWADYTHGVRGTSRIIDTTANSKYNTAKITNNLESFGFAKTYRDIRNRYIFQKYNPSGF